MLLAPDHAEPQAGAADDTVQLAGQPPADTPPAASSAGQTSEQNLEQAEALLGLFSAQQQQQVQAQVPAARPQRSEERRVGKESRAQRPADGGEKRNMTAE